MFFPSRMFALIVYLLLFLLVGTKNTVSVVYEDTSVDGKLNKLVPLGLYISIMVDYLFFNFFICGSNMLLVINISR